MYRRRLLMPLSIRLPRDIEERLDSLAARTGRSKTFYITEAVREHLADIEDIYLAEQRLIDIQQGRSKTIPIEELIKQHGLED
jgi:RHH-type transcriptional regulator, rel operon repressor / antitoxin RelB